MSAEMKPSNQTGVENNQQRRRYEIRVDGEVAGHAAYELRPGMIVFTETVIEPRFRGRGLGARLVAAALADAESRGLRILPRCPFVQKFIKLQPKPEKALSSRV